jgi:hypothetical protein
MLLEILRIFGMLLSAFAVAVLATTLALILGVVAYVAWEWWSTETHSTSQKQQLHRIL